jgi:carbonic anhydrase/acetyltransferase-like protein (isoleucine patch superfamily)
LPAIIRIASDLLAAFDLISIGEGASVDEGASLLGYTVEDGGLVIGPISVGRDCLVGTRSVLCPGAVMEDGARLEDLSLLLSGARTPAGETWFGSPAQRRFPTKNAARTDGARLEALSLLMKGEMLPAGPLWVGSPLDSSQMSARNAVA